MDINVEVNLDLDPNRWTGDLSTGKGVRDRGEKDGLRRGKEETTVSAKRNAKQSKAILGHGCRFLLMA